MNGHESHRRGDAPALHVGHVRGDLLERLVDLRQLLGVLLEFLIDLDYSALDKGLTFASPSGGTVRLASSNCQRCELMRSYLENRGYQLKQPHQEIYV